MLKYLLLSGITIPSVVLVVKNFSNIINFVKNYKTNYLVVREIYKNVSWKTFVEFCIYKARLLATKHLETGLITTVPGVVPSVNNIVYYDGCMKYCIRFQKKRGPCHFGQVTVTFDAIEETLDVTEKIRTFAGPSHNFHGIQTTPRMLGFSNLSFHFRNGVISKFEEDQVISTVPPVKLNTSTSTEDVSEK